MTRDRRLDLACLGVAGALWLAVFGLHLGELLRGRLAWNPVYVLAAADPGLGPVVAGFWDRPEVNAPGAAAGDRIVAIGDAPATGWSRLDFVTAVYAAADEMRRVPVTLERAGSVSSAVIQLMPVPYPWRTAILAVAFAGLGGVIFWRGRGSPVSRWLAVVCAGCAIYWSYFFGPNPTQTRIAILCFGLAPAIVCPAMLRVFLVFPREVARRGRVHRVWPWAFSLVGVAVSSWAFGWPLPGTWGLPAAMLANGAFIATLLTLLVVDYRRSGRRGRRQLRWVMLGLYLGLVPPLVASQLTLVAPRLWWLFEPAQLAWIAMPVCFFLAIDQLGAFDIDGLISATATYSLLTFLVLVIPAAALPSAVETLTASTDLAPTEVQTALTVVVIALVVPAQRWLKPRVERALFRERYELEEGALAVRDRLGRCEKPEELLTVLGESLARLVRPSCCVIYGATGSHYATVFAQGPALAPAFDAEGSLVSFLERSRLGVRMRTLTPEREGIEPSEWATLESMEVAAILPLRHGDDLMAFICLGAKRSGDVYTPHDLAQLQTLVDRASDQLLLFGEQEVHAQQRAMFEEMRRYVPGAIAEQVSEGERLVASEVDVSVLFVDIRGYTNISAKQAPDEVFSLVNRYTHAVSEAVRSEGGTVVEFNGDGMMAVFGAPGELDRKEEASVAAARRILESTSSILPGGDAPAEPIRVGVGIATGPAFVGNIAAVDRLIWSAIGTTTNLAARLQSLTRDLDAAVLMNARTADACRSLDGFELRHDVAVRGLDDPIEVFALPLAPRDEGRPGST